MRRRKNRRSELRPVAVALLLAFSVEVGAWAASVGLSLIAYGLATDVSSCATACAGSMLKTLGGATFATLISIGVGPMLLAPATLVLSPLAVALALRPCPVWLSAMVGALFGLLGGVPVTTMVLMSGDLASVTPNAFTEACLGFARNYGFTAAVAGGAFEWMLASMLGARRVQTLSPSGRAKGGDGA